VQEFLPWCSVTSELQRGGAHDEPVHREARRLSVGLEEAATTSAGRLCGQQPDASAKPRGVHGMRTAANKNIVLTAAGASRLTINCARVSSAAVTVLL